MSHSHIIRWKRIGAVSLVLLNSASFVAASSRATFHESLVSIEHRHSAFAVVDIKVRAKEVVQKQAAGDFEGVHNLFNAQLKQALPTERIEQTWNAVTQQLGSFESQAAPETTSRDNLRGVFIRLKFERGSAQIEIWFDSDDLIAGMWIKPAN